MKIPKNSSKHKSVLDVCCGSKMFYFNRNDSRVVFGDIRKLDTTLCDGRSLVVDPDIIMDFRSIPFSNNSFHCVVFDPPHLIKVGSKSWLALKYGKLNQFWEKDIRQGFTECFRVLKPNGILIFKWNERDIPIKSILKLTEQLPLLKWRNNLTHFVIFMKQ